jgi:hypothetical protein
VLEPLVPLLWHRLCAPHTHTASVRTITPSRTGLEDDTACSTV